ncbi:hypothetical protein FPZ43_16195 [Mucilaginibacter pallidiroseus]|uniref:Uncharacterized protein n=1 Tax=Mucilaginibacter pallidiroseus TaxID=2599295 RepID=A0A563U3C6_9SPHI|nr:hypothetical protein [Mucilaginibacter pallidiroseus]TWR25822.1 hypothetical protein FPZ43_16195 [Mucilaginibacter pallidiroseus]
MKTITTTGDPNTLNSVRVPKTQEFHDHEEVRIESTDQNSHVIRTIFRVVDAGEDKWELQFD